MVARDWSTKEDCQLSINYEYDQARLFYNDTVTAYNTFKASIGTETDPVTRAIFTKARYVLLAMYKVMYRLIIDNSEYTPRYAVPYFLDHYAGGDEFVLTWKEIVIAWGQASDPGKMWTITTMDQIRQNMWNKDPQIKWTENPFE